MSIGRNIQECVSGLDGVFEDLRNAYRDNQDPPISCPHIDETLGLIETATQSVKKSEKICRSVDDVDIQDVANDLDDAAYRLSLCEDELEKVRKINSELRSNNEALVEAIQSAIHKYHG
jgi:septation ring formation regulator EzrA